MSTNIFRPIFLDNLSRNQKDINQTLMHKLINIKAINPKNKLLNAHNAIKIFQKMYIMEEKSDEKGDAQKEETNQRESKTFHEGGSFYGDKKVISDYFRGKKLVKIPSKPMLKCKKGRYTDHIQPNQSLQLFSASKYHLKQTEKHYEHLSSEYRHLKTKRTKDFRENLSQKRPKIKQSSLIAAESNKNRMLIDNILTQRPTNMKGAIKTQQNHYKTVSSHEDSILIHKFR